MGETESLQAFLAIASKLGAHLNSVVYSSRHYSIFRKEVCSYAASNGTRYDAEFMSKIFSTKLADYIIMSKTMDEVVELYRNDYMASKDFQCPIMLCNSQDIIAQQSEEVSLMIEEINEEFRKYKLNTPLNSEDAGNLYNSVRLLSTQIVKRRNCNEPNILRIISKDFTRKYEDIISNGPINSRRFNDVMRYIGIDYRIGTRYGMFHIYKQSEKIFTKYSSLNKPMEDK